MPQHITPSSFLAVTLPLIRSGDAQALADAVKRRWTVIEVGRLLRDPSTDVRRVSAMVLGLTGDMTTCPALVRSLRDEDEQVARMAEHGLWSIWFRAGSCECRHPFTRAISALEAGQYDEAHEGFEQVIEIDPTFTEAYNQSAIALFLQGDWRGSLRRSCDAIKRVPTHFGALAGMGHCYTELSNLEMALRCYRHAVRINPRMEVVSSAMQRLSGIQAIERRANELSGEFSIDHIPI